jgi:hypothetical protein
MLRPHTPVYDSNVEAFFFLPKGPARESMNKKLQRLLLAYAFLSRKYNRVIEKGLLDRAIRRFRVRHNADGLFTLEKIMDTLIWRFVTILRRGGLRDRRVAYC